MGVPVGTQVAASSGNVAAAVATATLPAVSANRTNYLTGFDVTAGGATAGAIVNLTITGLLGGTRTYAYAAPTGAAVGANPLVVLFDPPLPASAANTAIVVSMPSLGAGNTNACVNAQGFHILSQ
jgi:hypothetical protein